MVEPADEELLDEARTRASARLSGRDRWTSYFLAAGFLVAACGLATIAPWRGKTSLALTLSFVLVYAITSRVEFEFGTGSAVPTQLVFVPMLLALPPAIVPLVAVVGFVLGACPDYLSGRMHPERALVLVGSSWYSLGPALVLVLAGVEGRPRLDSWPVYLAAISAQFVFDFTSVSLRERLASGGKSDNSSRSCFRYMRSTRSSHRSGSWRRSRAPAQVLRFCSSCRSWLCSRCSPGTGAGGSIVPLRSIAPTTVQARRRGVTRSPASQIAWRGRKQLLWQKLSERNRTARFP